MPHVLPALPYDYSALEPHIDARTMRLHHGQHHAGYVTSLNAALEALPKFREHSVAWLVCNIARLPVAVRTTVQNNAGGHLNHSMFWRSMSPTGGGAPSGSLEKAIKRDFGSLDKFKRQFAEAGTKLFGSGWVWLVRERKDGAALQICTTHGHDNPLTQGLVPLLVNDVWEHAYYLKYENRRAEYLESWWTIANWKAAELRFGRADHSAELEWEDDGGQVLAPIA